MKIAVITARFNESITRKLKAGALGVLDGKAEVDAFDVPGAVEIPLVAKMLAKKKQYDAIITLGAVIRGETSHFDYVCEQVSEGCQQVMMAFELPVIFGVLTTENVAQAQDRVGGRCGNKGEYAALAALEMVALLKGL